MVKLMKAGIEMTIRDFCEVCIEDEGYEARVFDVRTGDVVFSGSMDDVMESRFGDCALHGVCLLRDNIIEFDIVTEEE